MTFELGKLIQRWFALSLSAKLFLLASVSLAPIVGIASVFSGLLSNSKPVFLLAVPATLLLALLYLAAREYLLISILLLRGCLDPFLEVTKIPLGSTSIGFGAVLNGVILLLALTTPSKPKNTKNDQILYWAILFFAIMLVGAVRSTTQAEAIKFVFALFTYWAAFSIGASLTHKHGFAFALRIVLHASFLAALLSLFMWASGWRIYNGNESFIEKIEAAGRFSGAFSHPNIMAFFFLNAIIITLYLLPKEHKISGRLYLLAILASSTLLIVASKTRAAWAASILIFVVYTLIFNKRLIPWLLIGAATVALTPAVQDRLQDLADDRPYLVFSTLNSYEWRKQLWSEALRSMDWMQWVWGSGVRSFNTNSVQFFSLSGGNPFGAHSVYVQLIYETGVIGLFAASALLVRLTATFVASWVYSKDLTFLGVCFVAVYTITCYSDNILNYLVYNVYFWMALGAMHYLAGRLNTPLAKEKGFYTESSPA